MPEKYLRAARPSQAALPLAAPDGARPLSRGSGRTFATRASRWWNLPLVGIGLYLFVIHSHKVPWAALGIGIALVGLILEARPLRLPSFLLWFGAWIGWGLLSMAWSPHPDIVWDKVVLFSKLWLITFAAFNAIRTPGQLIGFIVMYLGMFALYPVRGTLFNFAFGISTFGRFAWNYSFANFNELAAYTILILALAVAAFHIGGKRWVRSAAGVGIFVLPVIIFLTQSRGGILGLALFGLALLAAERAKVRTFLVGLAVAGVVAIAAPESVWERIRGMQNLTSVETIGDADSSAEQRWLIWGVAGEIIRQSPVGGVGLGVYPKVHGQVSDANSDHAMARGERDTHSMYLNVLAETGIVGLVLLMGMLAAVFVRAIRAERVLRGHTDARPMLRASVALRSGLVGFLVAAIFAGMHREAHLYLFLAVLTHFASVAFEMWGDPKHTPRVSVRRPGA